ncbi:hypothetical protein Tco_1118977 [Tanacetum coccineum]
MKQTNRSSKRQLKIPIRFEDTIHELNGKLKNKAFIESSVESSSRGLDSMNSGEMQGKEDSGNGIGNEAKGANLNMNPNVVNGKGNEADSQNRVDGCIPEDVTPMIPKVNTTNVSPTPKIVNVPISTQANLVK